MQNSNWDRAVSVRALAALAALAVALRCGVDFAPALVADAPAPFLDSDFDGLSDGFETYLSVVSTDPALAPNWVNADTDNDGQSDGFEYCLSGRRSISTPEQTFPVVPKLTLGSYQIGSDLVLTLYVIPGLPASEDDFAMIAVAPGKNGPIMVPVTDWFKVSIQEVGFAMDGDHVMAVFQTRIPVSLLATTPVAIAAFGNFAGVMTGDSATFAVVDGRVYRWTQRVIQGADPTDTVVQAEAEPQDATATNAVANQVCSSTGTTVPTNIPGIVMRVPNPGTTGCHGGSWKCVNNDCQEGGPASQPMMTIDVDDFL